MKHTRREFLHALSAGAAVASLSRFGVSPAWAQSAPTDYKALVCIFLFGGNDGNNVVIGADTAGYTEYSAVRGAASGINIAVCRNCTPSWQPDRVFAVAFAAANTA